MAKIKIKGYTKGSGVRVRGHLKKDTGKPGRTPESEKWYEPGRHTGWDKEEPQEKRIRTILTSQSKALTPHNRRLRAFRQLNSLANVTADLETKQKARSDAIAIRSML